MIEAELHVDNSKSNDEFTLNNSFDDLLKSCHFSRTDEEKNLIKRAFHFAKEAHEGGVRYSGEPYIYHPIAVAKIVAETIGLDTTSVICALLHDVIHESEIKIEDIESIFGKKVSDILASINKIKKNIDLKNQTQGDIYRKILLSISEDVRVLFIKLADRLHNLRTLHFLAHERQVKAIQEAMFVYIPIAQRLGLYSIKTEMEDLCLKHTHPQVYFDIESRLKLNERKRNQFINKFSLPIIDRLTDEKINFEINGRPKSIYSIWNKMQNKKVPFDEVYDLFAIRIIFKPETLEKEVEECWKIYSIVAKLYQTKPDRLRDWITAPKGNGYEALHTTVLGPDNSWVEVQIRSERMNEIAEVGFAAHYIYKGISLHDDTFLNKQLKEVRQKIENAASNIDAVLNDFKLKFFTNEILVYTPRGDVISLPQNSTVIDFAFAIHTDLAMQCIGAKIDYKLVPVNQILKSGDEVEILTSTSQIPKYKWLTFVKTEKAKIHLKELFKERRKNEIWKGKVILENILRELNITANSNLFHDLRERFVFGKKEIFYYKIGTGAIREDDLIDEIRKKVKTKIITYWDIRFAEKQIKANPLIEFQLSTCCNIKPEDKIVGIEPKPDDNICTVYCPQCSELEQQKTIKLEWASNKMQATMVGLKITGIEKNNVFNHLTNLLNHNFKINVHSFLFESDSQLFSCKIDLFIPEKFSLEPFLEKIRNIKGVMNITKLDFQF